jgi:hypothetical protein
MLSLESRRVFPKYWRLILGKLEAHLEVLDAHLALVITWPWSLTLEPWRLTREPQNPPQVLIEGRSSEIFSKIATIKDLLLYNNMLYYSKSTDVK